MPDKLQNQKDTFGVPTGFFKYDETYGMGKTAMAIQIANYNAQRPRQANIYG